MSGTRQSPFGLEVDAHGRDAVVRLHGSLGAAEAEQLQQQLERLASDETPLTVVDLKDLDFVGSAGLAAIVLGHLRNRHHGGQIRLAGARGAVQDVLARTRLTSLFATYPSVEQALGGS